MSEKTQLLTSEQHLNIVSRFAVEMLDLSSVDDIIWYLAHNVVAQMGFEDVVIYLVDKTGNKLVQAAAFGNKNPKDYIILDPIELSFGEGVVGAVAEKQEPVLINDTSVVEGYVVDDEVRLSELAVPMIANGEFVGVIDSEHPDKDYYNKQHLHTLKAIASIAAVKIIKTRTIGALQKTVAQLEYSSKIQDALFEIAELIFNTSSMGEFYHKLHDCIGKLTVAENFFVAHLVENGKALCMPYFIDQYEGFEENTILPIDEKVPTITGYVLKTNEPLLVYPKDIERMVSRGCFSIIGEVPSSWLGVPFGDRESNRGVVVVQSYGEKPVFGEKEKQLLSFVAKHIHNAIDRMQARAQLEYLALHDTLTGLPNRALFTDRLERAIENCKHNRSKSLGLMFLDLDRFKQINDRFGHHTGDKLLKYIATLITACVRETDTICRLGGDEFAILIEQTHEGDCLERVAKGIVEAFVPLVEIDGITMNTSTSIGITSYSSGSIDADLLLVQADEAMYRAKLQGCNQYVFYQNIKDSRSSVANPLHDIAQAIVEGQLTFHYQPIMSIDTGGLSSAEALIRWEHPLQGMIPPDIFIPSLERANQTVMLDIFVFKTAVKTLSDWTSRGLVDDGFRLSVNISSSGASCEQLLESIKKVYHEAPLLLKHLTIEVTEQSLVDDVEKAKAYMKLYRDMGLKIAMDDFGTGYSSLSYLHQFTVDYLKIDRSFVSGNESKSESILQTIVQLAKSLNIETTAEGIETESQLSYLSMLGCTFGQGYLLSRPLPKKQFEADFLNAP